MRSDLTELQLTIIGVVKTHPNQLKRSEVAKLLIGSQSIRTQAWRESPFFGRLSHYKRKTLMHDIDALIQQRILQLDGLDRVAIGEYL